MATFCPDAFNARGGSLRPGHNQETQTNRQSKIVGVADTLVCTRLDFAGHCARLSITRIRRAIILGAHDPARDSYVGLGPAAGTRAPPDRISVGTAASLARESRRLGVHRFSRRSGHSF